MGGHSLSMPALVHMILYFGCLFNQAFGFISVLRGCLMGNYSAPFDYEKMLRACLGVHRVSARSNKGACPEGLVIEMDFYYIDITDVDDRSNTITLESNIEMKWKDHRLTWSPEIYGRIVELYIDPDYMWTPNFLVQNNVIDRKTWSQPMIKVPYSLGQNIEWDHTLFSKTFCEFNYERFPFDTLTCRVNIEHAIGGDKMLVSSTFKHPWIDEDIRAGFSMCMSTDSEWSVTNCYFEEKEIIERPGFKTYFSIVVKLSRNYQFHLYTIIYPSIILSAIIITIFWIPHHSKQRLVTGIGLFFSILFLTSLIHRFMPTGISKVTCLVAYMIYLMLLLSTSLIISLFTERIYSKKGGFVPDLIQRIFFNRLVSFITAVPLPPSTYPSVHDPSSMLTFEPYSSSSQPDKPLEQSSLSPSSPSATATAASSPEVKKMEKVLSDIRQNLIGLSFGEHLAASDEQWRSLALMADRFAFEVAVVINILVTFVIYTRW